MAVTLWREGEREERRGRERRKGAVAVFDDYGGAAGSGVHSGRGGEVEIGTTEETGPTLLLPGYV